MYSESVVLHNIRELTYIILEVALAMLCIISIILVGNKHGMHVLIPLILMCKLIHFLGKFIPIFIINLNFLGCVDLVCLADGP